MSTRILLLGAMIDGAPLIGSAQQAPAPDNTKANAQADQNTSDKESNAASDRAAHNVKVVTQNGQVTLSEPVRTGDEKQAVVQKAAEVAGQIRYRWRQSNS